MYKKEDCCVYHGSLFFFCSFYKHFIAILYKKRIKIYAIQILAKLVFCSIIKYDCADICGFMIARESILLKDHIIYPHIKEKKESEEWI